MCKNRQLLPRRQPWEMKCLHILPVREKEKEREREREGEREREREGERERGREGERVSNEDIPYSKLTNHDVWLAAAIK